MKNVLKYSALSAVAIAAVATAPVGADASVTTAQPGFYDVANNKYYSAAQFKLLTKAEKVAILTSENVYLHLGASIGVVSAKDAAAAKNDAELTTKLVAADKFTAANLDAIHAGATPVVKVESVSAITTTIEKAANQQLEIADQDGKKVTVKQLTDAGYTVKFLYNKTDLGIFNSTTGIVNGLAAGETFKYAVEVTPKEGKAITSAWVDVKVVDVASIEKVTKVQLTNKLAYINADETGVTVAATEAVNVGGKTVTVGLPAVKAISSSDETVLYANTDKTLKARKAGNVTLTVEFEGIKEKVTLAVEVKAQQVATSITDATVKTSLTDKKAQFKVVDADGKELRAGSKAATITAVVKDLDGKTVGTALSGDFAGGVEISSITKAGTYSVEVLDGTTKIGTYSLQVVDTANATADEYKILTAGNKTTAELDINPGKDANNTTILKVADYAKGVALGTTLNLTDTTKFEVVTATANSKVVTAKGNSNGTITLTAGTQTGSETIILKTVTGDYKETVATFTVTVKNTTPQVTSLTVKDSKNPIVLNESVVLSKIESAIKTEVVSKVQSNLESFTADLISKVEVTSQGTLIVTVKAENGGKEFTLPITLKDDVKPTITSATLGNAKVVVDNTAKTITFDVVDGDSYSGGTVAVNEVNVKAIITYGGKEYSIPSTTTSINLASYLTLFAEVGGKDGSVTGATLIKKSKLPVKLVDAAGNETPYTIIFE